MILDPTWNFGDWNKKAHNAFRFKKRKDISLEELEKLFKWLEQEALLMIEKYKSEVA